MTLVSSNRNNIRFLLVDSATADGIGKKNFVTPRFSKTDDKYFINPVSILKIVVSENYRITLKFS